MSRTPLKQLGMGAHFRPRFRRGSHRTMTCRSQCRNFAPGPRLLGPGPLARYCLRGLISAALIATSLSQAWAVPRTLTSLAAIHALNSTEANDALPVACEATVVYYRGYEGLLFVQDGDSAVFVRYPAPASILPGDRVFIRGKTQASFRTLVVATSVTVIQHGVLPKAAAATFEDLIRAKYDCRRVTVRARVRAADPVVSPAAPIRSARLQLVTDGGHIEANIDSFEEERRLKDLLDDEVEITGVAAGKFDDKMQQTGVILYVSKLADIRILKSANNKFWSLPITPLDQILSGYSVRDRTRRAQVRGTITYYEPGIAVVLQDGSKSLWISTQTRDPLRIGDYAVASGFPNAQDRLMTLTDAEFHDTDIYSPIKPQPATWEQLALWSSNKPIGHRNDLVSIEGIVVGDVQVASRDEYILSVDHKVFSAIYRHPRPPAAVLPMPHIPLGSRVRITGICSIDGTAINPGEEVPFDILMRSGDDIAVIAGPSLLSVRNLTALVGLMLVLLFGAGARSLAIERKVRRESFAAAYSERQRGRILEDVNGARPLPEIIDQITELTSYRLQGAPCWCRLADGAHLGNCPPKLTAFRILSEPIAGRAGPELGKIHAAFDPLAKSEANQSEILRAAAGMVTLAIETRRLYSELYHRSEFDPLTSVHNRFSLERYLDAQIEKACQTAGQVGLIYIDLNDFKQVNDVYGHKVGDLFLQDVAARMKNQLRSVDLLARLGGDEFVVVLPEIRNRREIEEIRQRLQSSFDDPFALDGHVLRGSASAGIALYPEDGATRGSLLSAADAHMYIAKQSRRQGGTPRSDIPMAGYSKTAKSIHPGLELAVRHETDVESTV